MSISENLKKACQEKNVNRIESIILRQINSDREKVNFEIVQSVQYAEKELAKSGIKLFTEDDGDSEFVTDQSSWTKELWQTLRTEIEYNFSKLKFDRIVEIMIYLREVDRHPDFQVIEKTRSKPKSQEVRTPTGKKSEDHTNVLSGKRKIEKKKTKPTNKNTTGKRQKVCYQTRTSGLEKLKGMLKESSMAETIIIGAIVGSVSGGALGIITGSIVRKSIVAGVVGALGGGVLKKLKGD